MKSQTVPSEMASVERSCPIDTATTAAAEPRRSAAARRDGAKQGERLDVDADELEARRAERLDVVVDRLPVGGREQDAPGDARPDSSTVSLTTW